MDIPEYFNYYEYINNYSDLSFFDRESAYIHYITYGEKEGRTYLTTNLYDFDPKSYRDRYGDLKHLSDDEIILHYIRYGKYEGRLFKLVDSDDVDTNIYRKLNENFEYLLDKPKKYISIVMSYYNNRKQQTLNTLNRFEELYLNKYNFEVIIVDDASEYIFALDDEIKKYNYPINLIKISKEEKGDRINPCIAYNMGFNATKGEIIIIQNPECFHFSDILKEIEGLDIMNYYYTVPVMSSPSNTHNDFVMNNLNMEKSELTKYLENENKNYPYHYCLGWYNNNNIAASTQHLHFCSVISRNNLDILCGFDENYGNGYWYDDNEFLCRIKKFLKCQFIDGLAIHQYHIKGSSELIKYSEKIEINKEKYSELLKTDTYENVSWDIDSSYIGLSGSVKKNRIVFSIYNMNYVKNELTDRFLDFINKSTETISDATITIVIDDNLNGNIYDELLKISKKNKIDLYKFNKNIDISHIKTKYAQIFEKYNTDYLHFFDVILNNYIEVNLFLDENDDNNDWYKDREFFYKIKKIVNNQYIDRLTISLSNKINREKYNKLLNNIDSNSINWNKDNENRVYKYRNRKHGFAISMYSDIKTKKERMLRSIKCFESIMKYSLNISIIVVIDGNILDWHYNEIINLCKGKNVEIYKLDKNMGISYVKNVCIKLLEQKDIDYFYLLDDDIEFLNDGIINYVNYIFTHCNIPLISNIHNDILKNNPEKFIYNNLTLYKTTNNGYYGNLIIINRLYIPIYGYFDILPQKWGYEHILLTQKYLQKTIFNNTSFDLSKYIFNGDNNIIYCHANNNIKYNYENVFINITTGSKLINKYNLNFVMNNGLIKKIL